MVKNNSTVSLLIALTILGSVGIACTTFTNNSTIQNVETPQTIKTVPATMPAVNLPTLTIPFQFESSCWPIKPLNTGSNIKGSLIFSKYDEKAFYWDIRSFRAELIVPNSGFWGPPPVSLDGSLLAYIPMDGNKLVVISPDQSISVDLPPGEYSIMYLMSGEILATLVTNREIHSEYYIDGIGFTDIYYVYNPRTGELTSHAIFLPSFTVNPYGKFVITYSPDMRYVLYHSSLPGEEIHGGFTLLDLASNEIIWTLPESNKLSGGGDVLPDMPIWKPDASSLTYIGLSNNERKYQNFYAISLDGTTTQFTEFEQVFEHGYILFSQPRWSPNMRYLTFKVEQYGHSGQPQLFIWDNKEQTLVNPCLPVEGITPFYDLIWSFDSEHIVVGLSYPKGYSDLPQYYNYRQMILDISNRTIIELPDENHRGEYSMLVGEGHYGILGWVNWEIP